MFLGDDLRSAARGFVIVFTRLVVACALLMGTADADHQVRKVSAGLKASTPLHAAATRHPQVGNVTAAPQDHSGQYPPTDIAIGARVYSASCAGCHGATGAAVGGIDLRRGPLPRAATDAALSAVITNGFPASGMPAFHLSPDDLRGLVAFIRSGFDAGGTPAPGTAGDPSRGRVLFESRGKCLDCHRVNDTGQYSGPDLTEIGASRSPAALERSLRDPTGSMRPINRPVRAVMRDGTTVMGRRLNEDTYTVQLLTTQGRLLSLIKTELREWSVSPTSPMPSYTNAFTAAEIADIISYLLSLKGSHP